MLFRSAVAIHAFQTNNRRVLKESVTENDVVYMQNKLHLIDSKFQPNDEQLADADQMIQRLAQAITLGELINRPVSSFAKTVYNTVTKSELVPKDFGIAVWLPKVVADIEARDNVQAETARYVSVSRHVGKIKDKVSLSFTVIERRWIRKFERWAVTGHDEKNNLVSFLTNHESLTQGAYQLTGKVKNHIEDDYRSGARVTQLHYVKAV